MNEIPHRRLLTVVAAAVLAQSCSPPDAGRPDPAARAYLEVLAAEDVRPAGGPDLATLVEATRSPAGFLRAVGVRALGRLENPGLAGEIEALVADADPSVRAEAANALAQAVHGRDGTAALASLLRRVEAETEPAVLGVLARSLGRLAVDDEGRRRVARALVALSRGPGGSDAPEDQLVGATLGMYAFMRARDGRPTSPALVARARELSRYGRGDTRPTLPMLRVRATALAALQAGGHATVLDVEGSLRDAWPEVRRIAASILRTLPGGPPSELIRRALLDEAAPVRLETVRAVAAGPRDGLACTRLLAAAQRDLDVGVRLAALDALDRPCADREGQMAALVGAVSSLAPGDTQDWHRAAHAIVALAGLDPATATGLLPPFVEHPSPFVRAYAARAAQRLGDVGLLRTLARDADANVRTTAAQALAAVEGRAADPVLVEMLGQARDPRLVLTLAVLLGGTEEAGALDAAAGALERLSSARRQTLRDPRLALVRLVSALGGPEEAEILEPYLRDFDAAVAGEAAAAMQAWTGDRYLAAPRSVTRLPLPTPAQVVEMGESTVVLHMARGGEIHIRLSPFVATTTGFRLWSMARDGTLDGLTFHRVAANFVIQGGSPGANEYAGHGAYTRDEVGLAAHWRGTVGISTRGRDTGDGQIFVNLADNLRLDHDYTVVGRVTEGMDVMDAVLEGDVITRAEVRTES